MTPNKVLNKVIAHELRHDIKPRAPPSSPTHSALACKQVKKLKKMAIKGRSSEEEEEEACQSSSNDDQDQMNPYLYKQVKKMNKYLKEINSMGYVVFLKDGPHHQLMKVEKKFKKNNKRRRRSPSMNHLPYLVNGLAVVKNQVLVQVMTQTRNSPPASDHHQTLVLWSNVWIAI